MSYIPENVRNEVKVRADSRCEYCRISEEIQLYPFHVDHIISIKHNGSSNPDNLAWACFDCNVAKGTDVAGYDPVTGKLTPLYNPRLQVWEQNFTITNEGYIQGQTPIGRLTVILLKFNFSGRESDRKALIDSDLW